MTTASFHSHFRLPFDRGLEDLSDTELLSLLLAGLRDGEDCRRQAQELLLHLGTAAAIGGRSPQELMQLGLSERQAASLLAADRLFRRVAGRSLQRGRAYASSRDVFQHFKSRLSHLQKECCWVLLLDGKNRLLRLKQVAEGSLTAALAHPREVFRPAVQEASAGIICVHNHPSGDPKPSVEDIELTRRLAETGRVLGIRLLDHVVVSDQSYFSFADQGLL